MAGSSPIKVAIVGGGVIGASIAQQLARAGANVILLTETVLTSGASGRSLSWLNAAGRWREPYHRLRIAGIDRYRTLSALQPGLRWLRFAGGLAWYPEDMIEELRRRHDHEVAHGYDSHLLRPEDVSAHTPGVNAAAIPDTGAIWNPGEGWVDLPSLVQFLIKDFVERGGKLVTKAGKCTIRSEADSVMGVATQGGQLVEADAVIVAAGAAVPGLLADLGVTIPDATAIAHLLTSRPVYHPLRAVLNTPRISVRPTPRARWRWTPTGQTLTSRAPKTAATSCLRASSSRSSPKPQTSWKASLN
jgi:glycine/D-amino acid oxidase-like deaminating enzyme